jgi:hypothetical protein
MWPFGSAIEPTSPGRVVRRDLNGLLAEFGQVKLLVFRAMPPVIGSPHVCAEGPATCESPYP